jgi:spore germination cell wall hydrolase CwlJ-like protein|tara:strand:- start:113 stop:754 length:642 start_codon:yes stop_codon:yes gene_type:complete
MKRLILFLTIILIPMMAVAVISIGMPSVQIEKVDTNGDVEPKPNLEPEVKEELPTPINVFDVEEARCLAENIYHEARNQGTAGWLAVAAVTLNRVTDDRFPDSICGVVFQSETRESWRTKGKDVPDIERVYYPVRHRCQFSWYCDGKPDDINQLGIYMDIMQFTKILLTSRVMMFDITDGATFYHADYVMPSWAKSKIKTIEIGDHIFYRWKR